MGDRDLSPKTAAQGSATRNAQPVDMGGRSEKAVVWEKAWNRLNDIVE